VDYAKRLEIYSFFTWHVFLQVGKTQDLPSKIWQTLGVALRWGTVGEDFFCFAKKSNNDNLGMGNYWSCSNEVCCDS
jgi:hypothetical protein